MKAPKFKAGDKVIHDRFGNGTIRQVWAAAHANGDETEYVVRLQGERYPATLAESHLARRSN